MYRLRGHPLTPSRAVVAINSDASRTGVGGLVVSFLVERTTFLEVPTPVRPARRDGLWQGTCFEFFVRTDEDGAYHEFNFSPSGEWAAYAWAGYRDSARDLALSVAPTIRTRSKDGWLTLEATLPPNAVPEHEADFGLSAVISERGDVFSYWALAHAPGGPDFHHSASFAARLNPARTPEPGTD